MLPKDKPQTIFGYRWVIIKSINKLLIKIWFTLRKDVLEIEILPLLTSRSLLIWFVYGNRSTSQQN